MSPLALVFFSFLLPLLLLLYFFFFFFFTHRVWKPSSNNIINGGKLPPSPPRLPIVGNLLQLGSQPYRSLRALADKHGSLMFLKLGSIPTIVVSSEEMAREVTQAQDQNFAFRPSTAFNRRFSYNCTDIVFAPYGEYWRQVRKIAVLHLLSAKKVQSFRRVREEEVALMVESIKKERSCSSYGGGAVVNLSKMLESMSNDIVSRASLGKKLYGEEGNNRTRFGELMKESRALAQAIHVGDCFPRLGWLSKLSGLEARMKRHAKEWDEFLSEVIDDHLRQRSSSGSEEAHQEDLLDVLLSLRHDESLTMDNVKALILAMLTAGTDTSYITIEWTIAELIHNPLIMKKVQEEIRRILVGKTAIEEEDISKMLYLKAVIKEALRLHPPVPIIVREAIETTHIKGYEIPRSTRVMMNVWAIGRTSKSWNSPEKFLPERFLESLIDIKGNDFHYIVFGAGRRICPGILFASSIIELALANLLHYFDWSLPYGKNHEDLDMAETYNGIMMGMKYNLVLVPTQYASTQSL